ncbi:MAG: hypothetical protein NY202_05775 [Mollicutes bacterium UO1]
MNLKRGAFDKIVKESQFNAENGDKQQTNQEQEQNGAEDTSNAGDSTAKDSGNSNSSSTAQSETERILQTALENNDSELIKLIKQQYGENGDNETNRRVFLNFLVGSGINFLNSDKTINYSEIRAILVLNEGSQNFGGGTSNPNSSFNQLPPKNNSLDLDQVRQKAI